MSTVHGGERVGDMPRISVFEARTTNHTRPGAVARKAEEERDHITRMMDAALVAAARQVIVEVPASERTDFESQTLRDIARDRRSWSSETVTTVLQVQSRRPETRTALSDALRAVEVSVSPVRLCSAEEASEAEQEADAATDQAQLKAAHSRAAAHWQAVRDCALRQIAKLWVLVDACTAKLSLTREAR